MSSLKDRLAQSLKEAEEERKRNDELLAELEARKKNDKTSKAAMNQLEKQVQNVVQWKKDKHKQSKATIAELEKEVRRVQQEKRKLVAEAKRKGRGKSEVLEARRKIQMLEGEIRKTERNQKQMIDKIKRKMKKHQEEAQAKSAELEEKRKAVNGLTKHQEGLQMKIRDQSSELLERHERVAELEAKIEKLNLESVCGGSNADDVDHLKEEVYESQQLMRKLKNELDKKEKRCKKLEEMVANNRKRKESVVELQKVKQEEALLQDRLDIETQQVASKLERQAELEKQLDEFSKAKNQELELATAQLEDLRGELTKKESDQEEMFALMEEQRKVLDQQREQCASLQVEVEKMKKEKLKEIGEQTTKINELSSELEAKNENEQTLKDELETQKRFIAELEELLSKKTSNAPEIQSEREVELRQQVHCLEDSLQRAIQNLKKARTRSSKKDDKIREQKTTLVDQQQQMATVKNQIDEVAKEWTRRNELMEQRRTEREELISNLKADNQTLQKELDLLRQQTKPEPPVQTNLQFDSLNFDITSTQLDQVNLDGLATFDTSFDGSNFSVGEFAEYSLGAPGASDVLTQPIAQPNSLFEETTIIDSDTLFGTKSPPGEDGETVIDSMTLFSDMTATMHSPIFDAPYVGEVGSYE